MSNTNTGGPAFPGPYVNDKGGLEAIWKQGGMTLRDYFAAKVIVQCIEMRSTHTRAGEAAYAVMRSAVDAYEVADAMLKARDA